MPSIFFINSLNAGAAANSWSISGTGVFSGNTGNLSGGTDGTLTQTATNLSDALNAALNPDFEASANGAVVTVQAQFAGTYANGTELSKVNGTNITLSGASLEGGVEEDVYAIKINTENAFVDEVSALLLVNNNGIERLRLSPAGNLSIAASLDVIGDITLGGNLSLPLLTVGEIDNLGTIETSGSLYINAANLFQVSGLFSSGSSSASSSWNSNTTLGFATSAFQLIWGGSGIPNENLVHLECTSTNGGINGRIFGIAEDGQLLSAHDHEFNFLSDVPSVAASASVVLTLTDYANLTGKYFTFSIPPQFGSPLYEGSAWSKGASLTEAAINLAAEINSNNSVNGLVSALASGSTITITGAGGFTGYSGNFIKWDTDAVVYPSITGFLSGGVDPVIAYKFDTVNVLTDADAKLASFKVNATEQLAITKSGNLLMGSGAISGWPTLTSRVRNNDGVAASGSIEVTGNPTATHWVEVGSSGQLVPGVDFAVSIGNQGVTADNLAAAINAAAPEVTATSPNGGVNSNFVYITYNEVGTVGNSTILNDNGPTQYVRSGSTLSGGTDVPVTAFSLDTTNDLIFAGDKLLKIKNMGVEKASLDKDGNTTVVGELKIKLYSQASEPTLTGDNFMAMWKDTDDSNKIYLVFRRGSGDQVKVQLT